MTGGYSLLELLVAVLVIAIGALGVAGLQLASSQNNRGALERSLATLLADDLLERMRANATVVYSAEIGDGPASFVDCTASSCTPDQLARFDLAVWKCALGRWREDAVCAAMPGGLGPHAGLPAGDGAVRVSGDGVTVAIAWQSGGERRLEIRALR